MWIFFWGGEGSGARMRRFRGGGAGCRGRGKGGKGDRGPRGEEEECASVRGVGEGARMGHHERGGRRMGKGVGGGSTTLEVPHHPPLCKPAPLSPLLPFPVRPPPSDLAEQALAVARVVGHDISCQVQELVAGRGIQQQQVGERLRGEGACGGGGDGG